MDPSTYTDHTLTLPSVYFSLGLFATRYSTQWAKGKTVEHTGSYCPNDMQVCPSHYVVYYKPGTIGRPNKCSHCNQGRPAVGVTTQITIFQFSPQLRLISSMGHGPSFKRPVIMQRLSRSPYICVYPIQSKCRRIPERAQ